MNRLSCPRGLVTSCLLGILSLIGAGQARADVVITWGPNISTGFDSAWRLSGGNGFSDYYLANDSFAENPAPLVFARSRNALASFIPPHDAGPSPPPSIFD